MKRFTAVFAVLSLAASLLVAWPAIAHHSGAMYDSSKTVTVEGTVKEFAWMNPHVILWIYVDSKDGQPPKTWFASSTSPGNLTRRGWSRTMFKTGDRIKVTLNPLRDGTAGGLLQHAIVLDTGKEFSSTDSTGDFDENGRPRVN